MHIHTPPSEQGQPRREACGLRQPRGCTPDVYMYACIIYIYIYIVCVYSVYIYIYIHTHTCIHNVYTYTHIYSSQAARLRDVR